MKYAQNWLISEDLLGTVLNVERVINGFFEIGKSLMNNHVSVRNRKIMCLVTSYLELCSKL